jgi:hypothetical protein
VLRQEFERQCLGQSSASFIYSFIHSFLYLYTYEVALQEGVEEDDTAV